MIKTGAIVMAILAGVPPALCGQQSDTARLDPVVVTATRVPMPLSAVAATVTVLDGDELRARGVRYVADALRDVPGMDIVRTGSFGGQTSLFVRGGESDYIKVLVDGVPLNEPGGAMNLADLSLDNVQRIEIVRGPVSVLYGSDAVTGVVQLFTKGGAGAARAALGVRAGTHGTREGELSLSGGAAGATFAVAAARRTTDGVYAFNNGYDNTTLSARLGAAPDRGTDVELAVRYTDAEFHFPTDGAGNVVDRNAFELSESLALALRATRRLSRHVEGVLLVSSHAVDDGLDDRADGADDTLGVYASRSQRDLQRRTVDGRLHVALGTTTTLVVGGAVEQERERSLQQSWSAFGTFTGGTDSTLARRNGAGYAQLVAAAGPVAANAGLRFDANRRFGRFVTYRAGLVYQIARATRVFASAGTGFKAPTFFENTGGGFVVGNPQLEPERSVTQEVGFEHALPGGRLTVRATTFRQRFRDLIDFTFVPAEPGDPNYFNIAAARADGIELELRAAPLPALTLRADYTYLHGEVTDSGFAGGTGSAFAQGGRLLRRPTYAMGLRASWRGLRRATLGASARYVGGRDDLDFSTFPFERVVLPAHTLVHLSAAIDVLDRAAGRPGLTVTGRVENALNERYEEALGFPAAGRIVLVGMEAEF